MPITTLEIQEKPNLFAVASRQIPFVVAKSLTRTAQQAQLDVRSHIRDTFVIRKKSGGFESSIAIKPATKTNWQAEVYTMAEFAAVQQTGGIRKPQKSTRLSIPDYRNISQVKSANSYRKKHSLAFIIRAKNGHEMIAQRRGGKKLHILMHLTHKADVPKRLDMVETVPLSVARHFVEHFNRTVREITSA
jgi:hypothetical protein